MKQQNSRRLHELNCPSTPCVPRWVIMYSAIADKVRSPSNCDCREMARPLSLRSAACGHVPSTQTLHVKTRRQSLSRGGWEAQQFSVCVVRVPSGS